MIDVETLALAKNYTDLKSNEAVSPQQIQNAVEEYLLKNPIKPIPIDDALSDSSINPVQNKIITKAIKDSKLKWEE